MSDLFQDGIASEFIKEIWNVMARADWHIFQILTKRPQNMLSVLRQHHLPTLPNVWLGTSVECADYKSRIGELRAVPAAIRFVSFEPLIGQIGKVDLTAIHWSIVGGESGPSARPMKANWVEEIRRQCLDQDVVFFFKQWGGVNKKSTGRQYRGRTWDDFPGAMDNTVI
jgi:protein gp37